MSDITPIQWCDSTVNPIMGCAGCELFPKPATILQKLDEAIIEVAPAWSKGRAKTIYSELIDAAYRAIPDPSESHKNEITTTNLYHLRDRFLDRVKETSGEEAREAARKSIAQQITCYAAKLTMNKGRSLLDPNRKGNSGHPDNFEDLTRYPTRMREAAEMADLLGRTSELTPWKEGLARMIFVSDMGDALSDRKDFDFLEENVVPEFHSEKGKRHLWLWLTKRPHLMAEFSERIGGFPENVCVMTTMTSCDRSNLKRLADLKKVKASIRGLSVEPLWEALPKEEFDLEGIDWVILGGESGSADDTRGFHLEWARDIREHCETQGVAYFLKQLGRKPYLDGDPIKLKDSHGGTWDEWPEEFRVREFPRQFHEFRKDERVDQLAPRPTSGKNDKLSPDEKKRLGQLQGTIKRGMKTFLAVGQALVEIKEKKLYRENHSNFGEYCDEVLGMSRQHANRLTLAARTKDRVDPVLKARGLPEVTTERHLREYARLDEDQTSEVVTKLADELEDKSRKEVSLKRLEELAREATLAPVPETGPEETEESEESEEPENEPVEVPAENASPPDDLEVELNKALSLARTGDRAGALSLLADLLAREQEEEAA